MGEPFCKSPDFHTAARENHFEVLEAMIRKGVNVNVTADSPAVAGTTPLHVAWVQIAVEEGRTEVLELMDI